ncbi:MAG: inner membrane CreD family protein [Actinobacteria bacterium]|nr:inner membrane CreD family protein [Actinomycetota bacterium]MCG2807809.1 inner membrane CreD family protein [Coriobacteriia bacterium]
MTGLRLFAIFVIFMAAAFGWVVLGGTVQYRTDDTGQGGWEQVGSLWGEPQTQSAPVFRSGKNVIPVVSSDIDAKFKLDQRRRGLLWYSTYGVDFAGAYGVRNASKESTAVTMQLAFPSPNGVYDGFAVSVDGKNLPVTYVNGAAVAQFTIDPGATASVATGYRTQGLDEWRYVATEGVGVIDDFSLTMSTDFQGYDFPADAVSPTGKEASADGSTLSWDYDSLVSGRPIAITMPKPINPGPVASRVSFFAPVSLMFYFASLILVSATRKIDIHPMNFAFLAAGFFAFHLLFAYLVDRIDLGLAFAIASTVSVGLCVAYLSAAVPDRRTVLAAAVGQFVFLVLFSFSFFFEGFTGLAVTIGAVLTLAYFMYSTARIDWSELFERNAAERRARRVAQLDQP